VEGKGKGNEILHNKITTIGRKRRRCAPKLLDRVKCEFEVKTSKEQGVGGYIPWLGALWE
jgi:hypothetical protein